MKNKQRELVQRAFTATLRSVDDEKGIIEGTPIVFGQETRLMDWGGQEYIEVIDEHALDEADLKDVRLFVNHDINKIALARSKNGGKNSTMWMKITKEGMNIRAMLDLENNAEARALYSAVQRGDMDGMSFMFRIEEEEWTDLDTDLPRRTIKKISIVHEVSVVNWPAYKQTSVNARSSEETGPSPLEEARKRYAEETARGDELEIEKQKLINRFI